MPNPQESAKVFLYVGGMDFERQFVKGTLYVDKLLRQKYHFDEEKLQLVYDPEGVHQEEWWSKYADPAFAFWFKSLR